MRKEAENLLVPPRQGEVFVAGLLKTAKTVALHKEGFSNRTSEKGSEIKTQENKVSTEKPNKERSMRNAL